MRGKISMGAQGGDCLGEGKRSSKTIADCMLQHLSFVDYLHFRIYQAFSVLSLLLCQLVSTETLCG